MNGKQKKWRLLLVFKYQQSVDLNNSKNNEVL